MVFLQVVLVALTKFWVKLLPFQAKRVILILKMNLFPNVYVMNVLPKVFLELKKRIGFIVGGAASKIHPLDSGVFGAFKHAGKHEVIGSVG